MWPGGSSGESEFYPEIEHHDLSAILAQFEFLSVLLDTVWGAGEDSNVVEVYVGYLRRKLGRSRIETVRGVGYRIPPCLPRCGASGG